MGNVCVDCSEVVKLCMGCKVVTRKGMKLPEVPATSAVSRAGVESFQDSGGRILTGGFLQKDERGCVLAAEDGWSRQQLTSLGHQTHQ